MICRLFLLSLCYCKVPIIINLKLKNMKDLEDDEREFPIRVYTKVELAPPSIISAVGCGTTNS